MISGRRPDNRTWENTYQVEVLDPDTNQPTGETRTDHCRYYEKATNLCYETLVDGQPAWVPAVPVFQPSAEIPDGFAVTQAQVQVTLGPNLGNGPHIAYAVDDFSMEISLEGLGFYETTTGRLVIFQEPASPKPVKIADNQIRYPGVFSGCDVDYEYSLVYFEQLVRINTPAGLSNPSLWGLDPDHTLLVAVSRFHFNNPDAEIVNAKAGLGLDLREEPSAFELRCDGRKVCSLAEGFAWDEDSSPYSGAPVYKTIIQHEGGKRLVEGIPYQWVMDEAHKYPLTLDFKIEKSGNAGGSEVWREGNTYYVSGTYLLASGDELVIEPGTVVKIGPNSAIAACGNGVITAKGTKFSYIIITSKDDDEPGEPLSQSDHVPAVGDYPVAFYNSAGDPVEYDHLKIRYGSMGINEVEYTVIRDCIFDQCGDAVFASGPDDVIIYNCLITNCESSGVHVSNISGDINLVVSFCTFDNNSGDDIAFVESYAVAWDASLGCVGTIFTRTGGKVIDTSDWTNGTVSASIFSHVAYSEDSVFDLSPSSPYVELEELPYDTVKTANGSHYLNNEDPGGAECRDFGPFWGSQMPGKTVNAPNEHTTGTYGSDTWPKVEEDTDYADLGYHYDRVDHVIGAYDTPGHVTFTEPLTIDEGVVIAFSLKFSTTVKITSGFIRFDDNSGEVVLDGTTDQRVLFTSTAATSDMFLTPSPGYYSEGLSLGNANEPVSWAIFEYASVGILATNMQDLLINNCVFRHCHTGIHFNDEQYRQASVKNCLFNALVENGIWIQRFGQVFVDYCTIDNADYGIRLDYNNGAHIEAAASYNLLTQMAHAGIGSTGTGDSHIVMLNADTNLFWRCATDVAGSYKDQNYDPVQPTNTNPKNGNPLFVNAGDAYQSSDIAPDGFYLSQNAGDYPRGVLVAKTIYDVDLSSHFETLLETGDTLEFWAYDNLERSAVTAKCTYTVGSAEAHAGNAQAKEILLLLTLSGSSSIEFTDSDYVDLHLDDGDSFRVFMPVGAHTAESGNLKLPLWIGEDGSTFWARRTKTQCTSTEPDQDAIYSARFDSDSPARSSNGSGGYTVSPAVDAGSASPASTTGFTSTNSTIDSAPLDLGYHYDGTVSP